MNSLPAKAKALATLLHEGQVYRWRPYVESHLEPIANAVRSMVAGDPDAHLYVAAAWLHDIIEDTPATYVMLDAIFPVDVVTAVAHLTREPPETYARYIELLAVSPGRAGRIARVVKLADLQWNLANCLYDEDYRGLATRYIESINYLMPSLRRDGEQRIKELDAEPVARNVGRVDR